LHDRAAVGAERFRGDPNGFVEDRLRLRCRDRETAECGDGAKMRISRPEAVDGVDRDPS
jgi:hypothetical protein